jgi:hypothetical protein
LIPTATRLDGHEVLPTSDAPQPVQGVLVSPLPSIVPELADEAPPYSSATGVSPSAATPISRARPSEHQEEAPLPPPPYERQGDQTGLPEPAEERAAQELREAMMGILRA